MPPEDTTAHAHGQNGAPRQSHREMQPCSAPGAHPSPESKGSGQPASQAGDTMVAKGSLGTPGLTHLAGSWLGG